MSKPNTRLVFAKAEDNVRALEEKAQRISNDGESLEEIATLTDNTATILEISSFVYPILAPLATVTEFTSEVIEGLSHLVKRNAKEANSRAVDERKALEEAIDFLDHALRTPPDVKPIRNNEHIPRESPHHQDLNNENLA